MSRVRFAGIRVRFVEEGSVRAVVPDWEFYGDPAKAPVFYNPAMKINRDISVGVVKLVGAGVVCEPLTGTGIRAVRYAVEAGATVVAGDISSTAVEFARLNAEINGVRDKVIVERADANALLYSMGEASCDVVDIDPFGSPAPYMRAAFHSVRDGGVVCVTATDVAVLAGRYPQKCLSRYGARVSRTLFAKELGLRVLMGYMARVAAEADVGFEPLIAYYEGHYYRVCVRAVRGARAARETLEHLGYVSRDRRIARRDAPGFMGPVWLGELGSWEFLDDLVRIVDNRVTRMLREEYTVARPLYYVSSEYAVGGSTPSVKNIIDVLMGVGIAAVRSHFDPSGFRADAEPWEVEKVLKTRLYTRI